MASIAWIASYPKSGNTWLRFMLTSYLLKEPIKSVRDVNQMIPDIGRMKRRDGNVPPERQVARPSLPLDRPGTLLVKTHDMPSTQSLLPYRSATAKIVYLVRNPRDIILSHIRQAGAEGSREESRKLAKDFIASHGMSSGQRGILEMGSWPENVLGWTVPAKARQYFPDAEVLTVRYEDMRAKPAEKLRQIVEFLDLGTAITAEEIQRAVEVNSLADMRALEIKERSAVPGMGRSPFGSRGTFVGQGLHNQSLASLGDDVEAEYRQLVQSGEEFSQCARMFGYDSRT